MKLTIETGVPWATRFCHGRGCNQLEVLKVGLNINEIQPGREVIEVFADLFHDLGKLKDIKLNIPIKVPVAQPVGRIAFNLRDPLEKLLDYCEKEDIIQCEWSNSMSITGRHAA